jgi:hypothetical protein
MTRHTYIGTQAFVTAYTSLTFLFGVKSGCVQMSFGAATSSVTQLSKQNKQQNNTAL